jgi:hypothetical protein
MPELPERYQRLDDSERHAVTGARLVGPADQAEAPTVTIALRRKPGAPELPDEQHWADIPPGTPPARAGMPAPAGPASAGTHCCTHSATTAIATSPRRGHAPRPVRSKESKPNGPWRYGPGKAAAAAVPNCRGLSRSAAARRRPAGALWH